MGGGPGEPWVLFGPLLEQLFGVRSGRRSRLPPRLVGYCVILGYGLECASLLYFKGEVILRHVFDGVKTVKELRPALSYGEGGGTSTMWVETRVIRAKSSRKE